VKKGGASWANRETAQRLGKGQKELTHIRRIKITHTRKVMKAEANSKGSPQNEKKKARVNSKERLRKKRFSHLQQSYLLGKGI